eukprot:TRINITY_DN12734_c0_g1_i14.p2 TRINITY_DN12734_c0_g1~~TRINITY_DN12734_c0_g1_i14.p2  ORF type:complete len:104 (+),score=24.87 TRINITY_DN12734_c0_g1_i14:36-314(+)
MIRRPPRSTHCISSAASDVYKRQAKDHTSATTKAVTKPFPKKEISQSTNECTEEKDRTSATTLGAESYSPQKAISKTMLEGIRTRGMDIARG